MHNWGDNFKYFSDVEQAAYEIGQFCRFWGRISVTQTKEKYGTARVYCSFGLWQLNNLFYPGYAYIQKPIWFMSINVPAWIGYAIVPYQEMIYRLAYKRATAKFPHIREEIIQGADYRELLGVM